MKPLFYRSLVVIALTVAGFVRPTVAAPFRTEAIEITTQRIPIVVGKVEMTALLRTAHNGLTQKKAVYLIEIVDKFEKRLYTKELSIPFRQFADDVFSNSVMIRSVTGASGAGIAVIVTDGPSRTAKQKMDLLSIRVTDTSWLKRSTFELVPIATDFPFQFIVSSDNAPIKLGNSDKWTYRYWTGSYYLKIPLLVDWHSGLVTVPDQTEFPIDVPTYRRIRGQILVRTKPVGRAATAYLETTPSANIQFLRGYGIPRLDHNRLKVDMPAIRVEVNKRSGWVTDEESLNVLGLVPR
ncbi:hypothetical protein EBR96_02390 [bacterium]|nr:hypothetical protein [bacterium]